MAFTVNDITVTIIRGPVWQHGKRETIASVVVSAGSYGVSGIPIPSAARFGLRDIDNFDLQQPDGASAGMWWYKVGVGSNVIRAFGHASTIASGFEEIASGTSLAQMRFRVAVIGR